MKKITLILGLLILLLPMVLAQTIEEQAGTTPASPLHGLDMAMERFQVFLTKDTADKIGLEISNAQERHAELITMFQEKRDTKLLKKSELQYQDNLGRAISLTAQLTDEQKEMILKIIEERVSDDKDDILKTEIPADIKEKFNDINHAVEQGNFVVVTQ